MRSGGWKPFWAALFASLLVLVPLVGGTVLLTRQMVRTRIQTAQKGLQPFLCIPCSSVPFWNRMGRDVLFYTETAARA